MSSLHFTQQRWAGKSGRRRLTSLPHLYSGAAFRASQLIDNRLFLGSDLFNLVYRSLGLKHVMSVFLDVSPACTTQYTVIKPVDAHDFTDRELAVFEELKPHLIQSWHGFRHLNANQRHLRTLTELWDCFSHAVFVFDRHRRIHFANRAAERLLRESNWMTSTEGRFRLLCTEANQSLDLAIAELSEGRRQIVSISQCTGLLTLYRIGSESTPCKRMAGIARAKGSAPNCNACCRLICSILESLIFSAQITHLGDVGSTTAMLK
jgi:PAS domain-containing protein